MIAPADREEFIRQAAVIIASGGASSLHQPHILAQRAVEIANELADALTPKSADEVAPEASSSGGPQLTPSRSRHR